MDFEKLERKIGDFIKEQVHLAGAKGVIVGLSGGLDSALVATLCHKVLNDSVFALIMPSKSSNEANLKDALMLCENLNLAYETVQIQPILDAFTKNCHALDKTRLGNLCARIRMSLLYDFSALKGYLVVGTSNKSERMLGYGTIYGDLACAFNPIGELYKSDIFEFAKFLALPQCFIDKAPSADFYEGQSDEGELGFKYADIDELLKALKKANTQIIAKADKNLLEMVEKRIKKNAFKNAMPTIFKDI